MSGFLNDEQIARATDMLSEDPPMESDEQEQEAQEATPDEASSDSAEDVNQGSEESEKEEEEEFEPGHRVPYKRFRSVLEARNDARSELDALRERNRELERTLLEKPKSRSSDSEHDYSSYDAPEEDPYEPSGYEDPGLKKFENLEQQIHELKVQDHKRQLMHELETVQEKYPNVPPTAVLDAVAQNPDLDMLEAAEAFNAFLVDREEAAIQRYLKDNPTSSDAPEAAPRPAVSSGSGLNAGRVSKDKRPKKMKDVRDALLSYVKEHNIF
jgi:hypothetical protein